LVESIYSLIQLEIRYKFNYEFQIF
jgi:hypothetical protein